jgi:hypothetical protein
VYKTRKGSAKSMFDIELNFEGKEEDDVWGER